MPFCRSDLRCIQSGQISFDRAPLHYAASCKRSVGLRLLSRKRVIDALRVIEKEGRCQCGGIARLHVCGTS